MASTGIERIDDLLSGIDPESIKTGSPDKEAVAVIQDLLTCHGFKGLPGIFDSSRGTFGPRTTEATAKFQEMHSLLQTGAVDTSTLLMLIILPAIKPEASHGYITMVLDFPYRSIIRLISLISQFEGAGSFTAVNSNTDGAGISFGLIQWAQKPGRLNELLRSFRVYCPTGFLHIFGEGDEATTNGLIEHTAKPGGGTDKKGNSTDPAFDLTAEPWRARFKRAGLNIDMQKVQVLCAKEAFTKSYRKISRYAPTLESERAIAFMLDLANQHGDGGARNIFEHVFMPGISEPDLLLKAQNESVVRVRRQFGNGPEVASTLNRRETFRTTSLLSDEPFLNDECGMMNDEKIMMSDK